MNNIFLTHPAPRKVPKTNYAPGYSSNLHGRMLIHFGSKLF